MYDIESEKSAVSASSSCGLTASNPDPAKDFSCCEAAITNIDLNWLGIEEYLFSTAL